MNKELNESFNILSRIYFDKSFSGIELNDYLTKLGKVDINTKLITKIIYGVLEKDVLLNYQVFNYVNKSTIKEMVLILKIGTYVGKFLNSIPRFTIVFELVELTKKLKGPSGLINATLKKLINNDFVYPKEINSDSYLSVKFSVPEWIIKELRKNYDVAFLTDMYSKELSTKTTIRELKPFENVLKENNIEYEVGPISKTYLVDYSKLLPLKLNDYYVVQGIPSIVDCLELDVKPNSKVLDVCSAPGGKTCFIAGIDSSITVIASDIYAHRIKLVESYAKRLGLTNVKTTLNDATIINNNWKNKFDYVLCDVPCSNLGVAVKKPDVYLNKTLADIRNLENIQYKILETSANYVKENGVLQYSTCSIMPSENENIINKFLKNHKEFKIESINNTGINVINNIGMHFYPHISNTEGFYICRMVKLCQTF